MGHPGKKLNFMTTDIGQYNEWNSEESLEWNLLDLVEMNRNFNLFAKDINHLYTKYPALYEVDFESEGFHWIDFSDALNSILSFYRISRDKKQILLFTFNMTPTIRENYTVGVPERGYWKEILNSDAEIYGGSGIGNMGGKESEPVKSKNWDNSIKLTLPPLAVNVFELVHALPNEVNAPGIDTVEDYYVDTDTEGGG
jgi:1,4-alpha-glucan branching enzyme